MGTNVVGKLAFFLALSGVLATACAWAQQKPQPSSAPGEGTPAKIKCSGEPYVSITADAEQALPLQLVATAACNEAVSILSDSQGYTLKVRTASGKIGYITRYEVMVVSSMKESDVAHSASTTTKADSSGIPMQGQETKLVVEPAPASDEKNSSRPRIYISDTQSWTDSGGFRNPSSLAPGALYGGYNPEMADIYQDFMSGCPDLAVVQEKSNADYAVLFDKGTSKKGLTGLGGLVKVNKVTVLSRSGETLVSQASHSAATVVRLACDALAQRATASRAPQPANAIH
jgi:hypothetical protein